MRIKLLLCVALCVLSTNAVSESSAEPQIDNLGKKIIKGPVGPGTYINVHIISDSVGIYGDNTKIINSVIEAPICISVNGLENYISQNDLRCNLCVQFRGTSLIDNTMSNNHCAGQGTNRPDVFGW